MAVAPSDAPWGKMPPRQSRAIGLLILAIASALTALPAILRPGWPRAHEHFAHFQRIEAFRRAFAAGIWYPIWTPFAARGFGSPYPLFYHRLYSTLGAMIVPFVGSVIGSVKTLTVLLLFLGGTGMRRLLRVSGASEWFAVAGGLMLIVAPYTLTDWLVRAAMAEFAAMMMLPWLYAELCLFLRGERHWIRLATGLVLSFHAHSVLCYFFLLGCVLFLGMSATPRWRACWNGVRPEWPRIAVALVIALAGIGPQAFVISRLMPYFNMDVMTQVQYARIENNYRPFFDYFASPVDWKLWQPDGLAVEMNRYVCLGILLISAIPGSPDRWRRAMATPLFSFMAIGTLLCLALQLPALEFVFDWIPKGRFLQFPWRLSAFMTIGAIFVFVTLSRELAAEQGSLLVGNVVLTLVTTLTLVHFGMVPQQRTEGLSSNDESWSAIHINDALVHLNGPNSAREYVLKEFAESGAAEPNRPFLVADGCADRIAAPAEFDGADFRVIAKLDSPCRISLRQFQTPMLKVNLTNATLLSKIPSPDYEIELQPGESSIRLRPRSFWELLDWAVRHREP